MSEKVNNYRYQWVNGMALVTHKGKTIAEAIWQPGHPQPKEAAAQNGQLISNALNAYEHSDNKTKAILAAALPAYEAMLQMRAMLAKRDVSLRGGALNEAIENLGFALFPDTSTKAKGQS